ncbi:hypothetical protein K437DRAFT_254348 [Tilletiaria anomala UBC 951]|uniref:Uncharacterized protein n=1 Tax=Tilletiaria anomala (strain ATCC 24038 / CBS 436.72 / UBC 951) TaxID=1037660 RepID=A0A066WF42_TILAU|nr:uncharacterized protein K437DRAFT_254348 [Tilletiaria anomala UBC 951]KDN52361.1 hypothetical protein K437DRAFT_254348 [Tilletiaria anomala UBC 951]
MPSALLHGRTLTHTVKKACDIFADPKWGFSDTAVPSQVMRWSTRPGLFRCRMRRNKDGTRAAFEVRLQERKLSKCPEKVKVIVYPIHLDAKGNRITDMLGVDGHFKVESRALEDPVMLPIIVELKDPECTSVMISVSRLREDGAYEVDLGRFVWYFGETATNGPRPMWQPRDIKGIIPRPSYASSLYSGTSDSASSFEVNNTDLSDTVRSKRIRRIASKAWRITKNVLGTPPGAGLGPEYAPERYDATHYTRVDPTGFMTSPTMDPLVYPGTSRARQSARCTGAQSLLVLDGGRMAHTPADGSIATRRDTKLLLSSEDGSHMSSLNRNPAGCAVSLAHTNIYGDAGNTRCLIHAH